MGKLLDRLLSVYAHSDISLKLKARFFMGVGIVVIPLFFAMGVESMYIRSMPVVPIFLIAALMVTGPIVLLVRGRFYIASHTMIICLMLTAWIVIFFDNSDPLVRLRTFVFTLALLSFLPLVVYRAKTIIFIYGMANILVLAGYIRYFGQVYNLSGKLMMGVFADYTIVAVFICMISYYVLTINEQIHDQLKTAQREIVLRRDLLSESEEKFSKAFHLSPHMICMVNLSKGIFEDISQSVTRILGYTAEDVVGRKIEDLEVWGDTPGYMKIRNILKTGNPATNVEMTVHAKDGTPKDLMVSSECVMISYEWRLILVAIDLTDHKKAEDEKADLKDRLRQAQKMEAVGHLAGGIAHDFNNMLSVVIGNTELSLMASSLDGKMKKRLENIHGAANRSAELVRQLLAFARKQTIVPKYLRINQVIDETLKMLKRLIRENVTLTWVPGDGIGEVLIDPSQVDQILANFLVNARDAIEGVGEITIKTGRIFLDEAFCEDHPGAVTGDFIQLSVSDTGSGMSESTMEKIFEPFFTTKEMGHGTGLGLATVYGIVKQNDGFIYVESELGRGTTFNVYLPVCESPAEKVAENCPDTLHRGSGTILIVEDDLAILEIGKSILEQAGYTVLTASESAMALGLAKSYPEEIDMILTDVVMPRMDGRELAGRIKEIRPHICCVYMSGYGFPSMVRHGVMEDDEFFLQKPFSVRALTNKVREVLDGSFASDG